MKICWLNVRENREWTAFQVGRQEAGSSLLCLAWYPCRHVEVQLVACGGCDGCCRIFLVSSGNVDFENEDYNSNGNSVPFDKLLR